MNPKIGVVILNWNNWSDTVACVDAVRKIDYPWEDLVPIIVDNGSTDESVSKFAQLDDVTLVKLDKNLGFAAGNNAGIQFALSKGCDYVLLLNNDTKLTANFLHPLLELFSNEQNVGIVSPKIYYTEPANKIWYAGGKFKEPRILGELIGMDQLDTGQFDQSRAVDFAVGACMLIDKKVFEKIGYLDDVLFFYHEDVDFSYRAGRQGFAIWFQPRSIIFHDVSYSTQANLPHRTYLYAQARTVFLFKHIRGIKIPLVLFLEIIRLLRSTVKYLLLGQLDHASSYIRGVIDGLIKSWPIYFSLA
jgi:GT2 family glycosyltransferase